MRRWSLVLALVLSVPFVACKKGGGEPAGSGGGGGAAMADLALGDLGLTISAPAGASARKIAGTMMVRASTFVVNVKKAGASFPATAEAAKAEAGSTYSAQNVGSAALDDGWAIWFTNSGGAGTNYWVQVRRTIGGAAYSCETTVSAESQQKAALAACKSLRQ